MKYGHKDKKTGVSLTRDVYAEQFAEPGDIKTSYRIEIDGYSILEGEDPQELAKQLMAISERFYKVADFLRRKGASRPTVNGPTGDK